MEIKIKKICTILDDFDREPWVLPNLQRPYVWKKEKIINFFDSLMQGYPVGILLLWDLYSKDDSQNNNVGFYRFIKSNNATNEQYLSEAKDNPKAVLDGQQRLTTLNIGLRGTYDDGMLYLNIKKLDDTKSNEDKNNDNKFEFDFFSLKKLERLAKAKNANYEVILESLNQIQFPIIFKENNNCWFLMNALISKERYSKSLRTFLNDDEYDYYDTTFRNFLNFEIGYYEISSDMSDKALDIFVRVNSGGQVLEKSDLLFSMLINSTNENIREKIVNMLKDIKTKYKDSQSISNISKDVFLRLCLCLYSDNVTYSLNNFRGDKGKLIMSKIVSEFDTIKVALEKSVEFLCRYCGYGELKSLSTYPIIITALMYYKNNNKLSDELIKELTNFINLANFKNVFSGSSDVTLGQIRNALAEKNYKKVDIKDINESIKPRKNLDVSENDINDILDYDFRKNYNYIFNILWLIQGNLNTDNTYHIDHIYPQSLTKKVNDVEFTNAINSIANTQMLFSPKNIGKSDKNPKEWLDEKSQTERKLILECNFINYDKLVSNDDIEGIKEFIEDRKKELKKKLKERFKA